MIKHHEFWNPRLFELPYYCYLLFKCFANGLKVKDLAKANYNLDHGEIGIGSKYQTQLAFDQSFFLPTELIKGDLSNEEKINKINNFITEHGLPVILKSDVGCVGKGICKITNKNDVLKKTPLLLGDYILQKFTSIPEEYGIFFTRKKGKPCISGINKKHFPSVMGNGFDSVITLAKNHERYSHHWQSFLQNIDEKKILRKGEELKLSFIGSHTLGCKFTDDTHLITPKLEQSIFKLFESQPGYNYGRCDVKTESADALRSGQFKLIEINGVASLPTNMFDPKYKYFEAYRIFLSHGAALIDIAKEHQHREVKLKSYKEIMKAVKKNQSQLNLVHERLKGRSD